MSRVSVSANSSNNASDDHKMVYEVQASSTANGSRLIEPVKGQRKERGVFMNIYEAKQAAEIFLFKRLHYYFFHSSDEVTALKSRHLSVSQLPLTIRHIKSFKYIYISTNRNRKNQTHTILSKQFCGLRIGPD